MTPVMISLNSLAANDIFPAWLDEKVSQHSI